MKWLITGAAGYIGAHVVREFIEHGVEIICLDNLSTGIAARVNQVSELHNLDINNEEGVRRLLISEEVNGIINLAGLKSVEESIRDPERYRLVNQIGVHSLVKASQGTGVQAFLQSSTAAVYGNSGKKKVSENDLASPISPYGATKLNAEKILRSETLLSGIRHSSLRYFNVAGAVSTHLKDHSVTNLIPQVIEAIEKKEQPKIFGSDYKTIDRTCVRDFIHVGDIARAHLLAAKAMETRDIPQILNIGSGQGFSVLQVINEAILQLDSKTKPLYLPRRPGDVDELVANADLFNSEFIFTTQFSLPQIISSVLT